MSLATVKAIRQQVLEATIDAQNIENLIGHAGWIYTPVYWTGSHLHPRLVAVLYGGKKRVRP